MRPLTMRSKENHIVLHSVYRLLKKYNGNYPQVSYTHLLCLYDCNILPNGFKVQKNSNIYMILFQGHQTFNDI